MGASDAFGRGAPLRTVRRPGSMWQIICGGSGARERIILARFPRTHVLIPSCLVYTVNKGAARPEGFFKHAQILNCSKCERDVVQQGTPRELLQHLRGLTLMTLPSLGATST